MNKHKLTSLQFSCLIVFPILSLFSGIGTKNIIQIAGVDSYLSVIISFLIGLLPMILFICIFNYKEELTIIEKIEFLFGKYLGTFINFLIVILVFCIGVILLYNISNFAISQFLSETPIIVFMVLFGIVLVYNVSLGMTNISRVSLVFLAIVCMLTVFSVSGIAPHFDSSNIKPFLEYGIGKPLCGGVLLAITNVIPIFMLLIVAKSRIIDVKKTNKYLFLFYTLAFLFIFVAIFFTIGALGIHLSRLYQYPEYTVLKKISLFNFIDRIENFIYVKWILSSFVCLSLIIYYISYNISYIINRPSKRLVPVLVTGFIIYTSVMIFRNNTFFYTVSFSVFPYICGMLLVIYIIIGLNILVRTVMDKVM